MKNNDQRSSLVWFIIGLAILFYSTQYKLGTFSTPGPGFVPFLTGAAIALLSAVIFFQQVMKKQERDLIALWDKKDWRTMLKVMGALVLYTVFLKTLGFLPASFLLMAYLLRVMEPVSWKRVFLGAFLISLGSYAVFQLWLQSQLPRGILGF